MVGDHADKVTDGEFYRVAEIHRLPRIRVGFHQGKETGDEIADVAEGARLLSAAVNRQRLTPQCLNDEVGNDAAVVRSHPWAVGIEYAGHTNVGAAGTQHVEAQGLGSTLALVVAGARP